MKKFLGLVCFSVFLSGGLYAQTLNWTGTFDIGFWHYIPNGEEGVIRPTTVFDSNRDVFKLWLTGSYSNANSSAGIYARLEASGSNQSKPFNLDKAWVWFRPLALNSKLTIYAGNLDSPTFNSTPLFYARDMDEGMGMMFILRPINGLILGAGGFTSMNWAEDITLKPEDMKYTFNLYYLVPRLFKLTLTGRTANKLGSAKMSWNLRDADTDARALFSIDQRYFENLTAAFQADFRALDDLKENGRMDLHQTFGYKWTGLGLEAFLELGQYLPMKKLLPHNAEIPMFFWAWAAYNALDGKVIPRLDAAFLISSTLYTYPPPGLVKYIRRTRQVEPVFINDSNEFIIFPSVAFFFDSRSNIELGYRLEAKMKKNTDDEYYQWVYAGYKVQF